MTVKAPRVPPLVFRPTSEESRTSFDSHSDFAYSASLPDSTLPPLAAVSFERDDRPNRPKSLPRYSPLPGARSPTPIISGPGARKTPPSTRVPTEDPLFVVDKPKGSRFSTLHMTQVSSHASRRSSMPSSMTDSMSTEKSTISYQASSFLYGVIMGLLPPLILLRMILSVCFPALDSPSTVNHRYYVYGRSIGLLILVTAIIVIVLVVKYR